MNSTDSCTLKLKVSNCQLTKDLYSCTPGTNVFRGDNFAVHIFLWVGWGKLPLTKTQSKTKDVSQGKRKRKLSYTVLGLWTDSFYIYFF